MNFFLILVGSAAALHLLCTATFLPKHTPFSIVVEVSLGFASAVGVVVTAIHADQQRALMFLAVLSLLLIAFSIEKALRGKTFLVQMYTSPKPPVHRRRVDQVPSKGKVCH